MVVDERGEEESRGASRLFWDEQSSTLSSVFIVFGVAPPHLFSLRFLAHLEFVPACLEFAVLCESQERMLPLIRDLNKYPKITSKNHDPEEVRGSFGTGFNAMPYKRGNPSTVPFLAS